MLVDYQQLGEFGEQEVRARLERALSGTGMRLSGFADKGIDLILQYSSLNAQPFHFGVQVKTGTSFVENDKSHWRIKNLDEIRFNQWKSSKLPILFVWVHPANPAECYWQFVRKNTDRHHFMISKKSTISPVVRYDYALEYFAPSENRQEKPIKILRPPLSVGIRPYAKDYYRNSLIPVTVNHPLLGSVKFSWQGWKHITSSKRPTYYIHQSLELLTVVQWALENPQEFVGIRRLGSTIRGKWVTDRRILIFKTTNILVAPKGQVDAVVVLRQLIRYPVNWMHNVMLHKEVQQEVFFESIYEVGQKR